MPGSILPASDDGEPAAYVTDLNFTQSSQPVHDQHQQDSLLRRVNRIVDETRQQEEHRKQAIAQTRIQLAVGGFILIALGFSTTGTFWYHLAETDLRYGPTGLMQVEPLHLTLFALATTTVGASLLVAAGAYGRDRP